MQQLQKLQEQMEQAQAQLTSVMTNNLLRSRFAFHNLTHFTEVIPILPEFTQPVGIFDTRKIPYVIEEGRRAAMPHIAYIRKLMAEVPA
jgi:NTE family protein